MSAITFERPFIKAEKPTTQPANRGCSREEEFRAALDSYIARYVAEQTNRVLVVSSSNNPHALMWLQPLRRLRKATRQIWRFRTDWRGLAAPASTFRIGAQNGSDLDLERLPEFAQERTPVGRQSARL